MGIGVKIITNTKNKMPKSDITKKKAKNLRKEVLLSQWDKCFKDKVIKFLPIRVQRNFSNYKVPKIKTQSSFVYGEAGCGKTIYASFFFVEMFKHFYLKKYYSGVKAYFINYNEFFQELQKLIKERDSDYGELVRKYAECDLLVIDDFGVRKTTEFVLDIVYFIINYRYENELTTLITSNLSISELADRLNDDRIVRRIEETYLVLKKKHYSK